jgi:hypothetical protein
MPDVYSECRLNGEPVRISVEHTRKMTDTPFTGFRHYLAIKGTSDTLSKGERWMAEEGRYAGFTDKRANTYMLPHFLNRNQLEAVQKIQDDLLKNRVYRWPVVLLNLLGLQERSKKYFTSGISLPPAQSPVYLKFLDRAKKADPGPRISDMDLSLLWALTTHIGLLEQEYSWLSDAILPLVVYPTPPNMEEILTDVAIPAWVPMLMHNESVTAEEKDLALAAIGLLSIDEDSTSLADDWPYELTIAYWMMSSSSTSGWWDNVPTDTAQHMGTVPAGHTAQQTLTSIGTSEVDKVRLMVYTDDSKEKWFDVSVTSGKYQACGTCKYTQSGIVEVYLDKAVVTTGGKVTISLTVDNDDLRVYGFADQNRTVYLDNAPVPGYGLWISLHNARTGPTGGTLTGVKAVTGINENVSIIVTDAFSVLDGQTSIHPDRFTDFSRLLIIGTAFNSTTNSTETVTKLYSDKSGVTLGYDMMNSQVNVYITGSDTTACGLLESLLNGVDGVSPSILTADEIEQTLLSGAKGILVVAGAIPQTALSLDKNGLSLIAGWVGSGNQLVTVGDAPLESVYNEIGRAHV